MLARIPGQDTNGRGSGGVVSAARGFRSPPAAEEGLAVVPGSTEILINGKRNAGKNNSTQQMLQRIASSQVQEIQIIRGTSGDLDVRGSGQIINVVLFEELSSNSFSYQDPSTIHRTMQFNRAALSRSTANGAHSTTR